MAGNLKICSKHNKPNIYGYNSTLTNGCALCIIEKESDKRHAPKEKVKKTGLKSKVRKVKTTLYEKSLPRLLEIARDEFNLFIRNRDRLPNNRFYCPTCDTQKTIEGDNYQACHCFPAGFYSWIKFNENNVFGGCKSCNYFKHGASYVYNDWVRNKIGESEYKKLTDLNDYWKGKTYKWDKFTIIEIIKTYKEKNKLFIL
jgi:hypothetical protein